MTSIGPVAQSQLTSVGPVPPATDDAHWPRVTKTIDLRWPRAARMLYAADDGAGDEEDDDVTCSCAHAHPKSLTRVPMIIGVAMVVNYCALEWRLDFAACRPKSSAALAADGAAFGGTQ